VVIKAKGWHQINLALFFLSSFFPISFLLSLGF
jgi:hypothetical protein